MRTFLYRILKVAFYIGFHLIATGSHAQEITRLSLDQAYHLAEQNYPLIKQKELIRQTENISIQNLRTAFQPQLTLSGQVGYQSAVTHINLDVPGFKMEPISKDQYRVISDINQLLYDGGVVKSQRELQQAQTTVDQAKVDVDLYELKSRVVQIFFSILYQDELLKQVELITNDLKLGIEKVQAQVAQGVVLRSNLQVLQVQQLQTQQRAVEIKSTRQGLLEALSLFINQPFNKNVQLEKPAVEAVMDTIIHRPELSWFQHQQELLDYRKSLIQAKNKPKASLFWQGGYGRPGLNMLSNQFDFFYITGLRFTWPIGGYYTQKREKQLVDINKQTVEVQQSVFLLQTQAQLKQQKADIEKYQELIASDQEIVELRNKITEAAKAQLENAVINAHDYLREVNAADAARQTLVTHQLQLTQAQVAYLLTSGKL